MTNDVSERGSAAMAEADYITKRIGTDWSIPRAKIYISYLVLEKNKHIALLESQIKEINSELSFERAVNTRVVEITKGLLKELKDEKIA